MTFIVRWAMGEATLYAFTTLMESAFESISEYITLKSVRHSLLEFVCSIPERLVEKFTQLVHEKRKVLESQRVIKVKVEEHVIFDVSVAM